MRAYPIRIVGTTLILLLVLAQRSAGQSVSQLTYPQNGSSSIDPIATFSWTAVPEAQVYYLYVGSAPGLKDVYDGGETTATSITVQLPFGGKFYATVDTKSNNTWHFGPLISFTTANRATLQTPLNHSSGLQDPVQFSWAARLGASGYYLYVGNTPGAQDVYDSGEVQTTQLSVALHTGAYYARLWTKIGGHWYFSPDISFSTVAPTAQILFPANNAVLSGASPVSFSWNVVPNATVYYLYVGTAPGLKDVIDTGEITTTQFSRLLNPGIYYATVDTEVAQDWYFSPSVSFTVAGSSLTFPPNGSTSVDPYVDFSWAPFPNATGYSLAVGTSPGASDALATGTISATSFQVSPPLQANATYYVQLGTNTASGWTYSNSIFTSGTGIAHLLSPADGSINVDPFSKLSWNSVLGAQTYYVYVGSAQGLTDVYDSGEIAATSLAVPAIKGNTTYFVRLWTKKSSIWYFTDSTFTTGPGIATMVYPADKETNVDPALSFQWSLDPRALAYYVDIGTTLGGNDIYDSGEIQGTSLSIPDRCTGTCYIRLSTKEADQWRYVDSSFTVGNFIAHLTAPANQSLADPYAVFTWTTVPNVDAYYLYVGTTQGSDDVFDSGGLTSTSIFVPNLVSGNTYCVRLYTFRGGVWLYSDSTFLAGNGLAVLSGPQNGAAISPFETFTWTVPQFPADAYYLIIGTSAGARDVFDSGVLQGTSVIPPGLDFSKTYYATLSSLKNNIWWPVQSTFTTLDQNAIPNLAAVRANFYSQIQQATAAVRMMADPATNIATPGTPLDTFLQQNGLNLASCDQYAEILQQQLETLGIASRLRYITLDSYESHTALEYYDPFLQKWSVADATFGFMFFDPTNQTGQGVEEAQGLVLSNNFSGIHVTTVTTYGDSILRGYYLDPLTLYTNVTPPGQPVTHGPQPNSPFQFLLQVPLQSILGLTSTNIFTFGSSSEQAQIGLPDGNSVTLVPVDGTLFSAAIMLPTGWTLISAPSDLTAYSFIRPVY